MRIARALDLYAAGAEYHIECLEEEGLVILVEEGTEERSLIEHLYELVAEGDAVVEQAPDDETESEDKPS